MMYLAALLLSSPVAPVSPFGDDRTLHRSGILLSILEVSLQIFEELYWKFFKDTKGT